METLNQIKSYAYQRPTIRINCCGYQNTRITKLTIRVLKGIVKQITNYPQIDKNNELPLIQKEIEFRELCLQLKSVFKIDLK